MIQPSFCVSVLLKKQSFMEIKGHAISPQVQHRSRAGGNGMSSKRPLNMDGNFSHEKRKSVTTTSNEIGAGIMKKHETYQSVIAQYIHRFRFQGPADRTHRIQADSEAFWWAKELRGDEKNTQQQQQQQQQKANNTNEQEQTAHMTTNQKIDSETEYKKTQENAAAKSTSFSSRNGKKTLPVVPAIDMTQLQFHNESVEDIETTISDSEVSSGFSNGADSASSRSRRVRKLSDDLANSVITDRSVMSTVSVNDIGDAVAELINIKQPIDKDGILKEDHRAVQFSDTSENAQKISNFLDNLQTSHSNLKSVAHSREPEMGKQLCDLPNQQNKAKTFDMKLDAATGVDDLLLQWRQRRQTEIVQMPDLKSSSQQLRLQSIIPTHKSWPEIHYDALLNKYGLLENTSHAFRNDAQLPGFPLSAFRRTRRSSHTSTKPLTQHQESQFKASHVDAVCQMSPIESPSNAPNEKKASVYCSTACQTSPIESPSNAPNEKKASVYCSTACQTSPIESPSNAPNEKKASVYCSTACQTSPIESPSNAPNEKKASVSKPSPLAHACELCSAHDVPDASCSMHSTVHSAPFVRLTIARKSTKCDCCRSIHIRNDEVDSSRRHIERRPAETFSEVHFQRSGARAEAIELQTQRSDASVQVAAVQVDAATQSEKDMVHTPPYEAEFLSAEFVNCYTSAATTNDIVHRMVDSELSRPMESLASMWDSLTLQTVSTESMSHDSIPSLNGEHQGDVHSLVGPVAYISADANESFLNANVPADAVACSAQLPLLKQIEVVSCSTQTTCDHKDPKDYVENQIDFAHTNDITIDSEHILPAYSDPAASSDAAACTTSNIVEDDQILSAHFNDVETIPEHSSSTPVSILPSVSQPDHQPFDSTITNKASIPAMEATSSIKFEVAVPAAKPSWFALLPSNMTNQRLPEPLDSEELALLVADLPDDIEKQPDILGSVLRAIVSRSLGIQVSD